MSAPAYLFDTNAIIEAVRTGCWPAITGGLRIETVEECREECLRGDTFSHTGYIRVSEADLHRVAAVHPVSDEHRAALVLVEHAAALDDGERDLFAHAYDRSDHNAWLICSPDRASVRLAVALGWGDRLVSLEAAATAVGHRPNPSLRAHFTDRWLSQARTQALLDG